MSRAKKSSLEIGQPVRFYHRQRELGGIVARLSGEAVFVLGDDRQSYRLPCDQLQPMARELPVPPAESPALPAPSAASLEVGEEVAFRCRERQLRGRIVRLNPKRAHVLCANDEEYAVPYRLIERLTNHSGDSAGRLAEISGLAGELLAKHGLVEWIFDFDHASRRAGSCDYRRRRITLALQFARRASAAEIQDTLLHEIAHALVGRRHNHDAVWRAKALEIGCSAERCHKVRFTPPRYIVACRHGCWRATAERRRRNVVCSECRGEIVYQTYSEARWRQGQPPGRGRT